MILLKFSCWDSIYLCIRSGTFNYDSNYRGATAKSLSMLKEDTELSKDGFVINHSKILVGSGSDAYEKGKTALQTWRFVYIFINFPMNILGHTVFKCRQFSVIWVGLLIITTTVTNFQFANL